MPPRARRRYDWGAPDAQEGPKKNLKYNLIVQGVQKLIEEHGLDASKVAIWIDWQVAARRPWPFAPAAAHPRSALPP